MKNLTAKIAGGLALTTLSATLFAAPTLSAGKDLKEESRNLSGFDSIKSKGPIDTHITVGGKFAVSVKAKDGMLQKVETEVKGDTLTIKLKKGRYNWKEHEAITVYVTLPVLEELTSSGSGDSFVKGQIKGDKFEVSINGSGDISIDKSDAKLLNIGLNGSGDLKIVNGNCDQIEASLRGSGDIDARAVKCGTADFSIMGSGDILAYAEKSLKANIMGSGDVTVYGSPAKVSSRTWGSGEVHTRR